MHATVQRALTALIAYGHAQDWEYCRELLEEHPCDPGGKFEEIPASEPSHRKATGVA
jgi:hypothetical protein